MSKILPSSSLGQNSLSLLYLWCHSQKNATQTKIFFSANL